jgi:hypothetical protein
MKPHAELEKQNPDKIVDLLLTQTTKQELKHLVEAASAASGVAVSGASFEPGDELCPTFKFPFPFPPRFVDFLNHVASQRSRIKLFPMGIIGPEEVLVQTLPRMGR